MLDVNGTFRCVRSERKINTKTNKPYFQISAVHNFSVRDQDGNWHQADNPIWVNFQYYKDIPLQQLFTASFSSKPWLANDGKVLVNWFSSWLMLIPKRENIGAPQVSHSDDGFAGGYDGGFDS